MKIAILLLLPFLALGQFTGARLGDGDLIVFDNLDGTRGHYLNAHPDYFAIPAGSVTVFQVVGRGANAKFVKK